MTVYFVDTSALAKRYLPEVGSEWVQSWINPQAGHVILISAVSTVEFVSLLARLRREGNVSDDDFNRFRLDFLAHASAQYRVIGLRPEVLVQAQHLVSQYPLRTLDALQLASAHLAANAIGSQPCIVSGDARLLAAAKAEGFPTENPADHL